MKKLLICVLTLALLCGALTACGGKTAPEETDEEDYTTGDATLDDPRNQDGIGEKELLVVSFGTSFNDNRRETIGAIEGALEEAFPDWSVRRAFTSQIIIDHVKSRDGEVIDNVTEALERAVANGVKELVVQPTHLMDGFEYHDLVDEIAQYSDAFERVAVGAPLLTTDDDFDAVADAIFTATAQYDDGETAICFMGHGTEAASNAVYEKMQGVLGVGNYYIGTVEAEPTVEDVLAAVRQGSYKRVVLRPLMVVAGDHANNDMAGDDEDSWKSVFEAAGYEVECVLEGLGSLESIQQLYVAHAREAAGGSAGVSAAALNGGTYPIAVDCSSTMFKIESCELIVEADAMMAELTMGSDAFGYLFAGTAEEAAAADEARYIVPNGRKFAFSIDALDTDVPCAAWSRNKEQWYDRTLVFRSDSLPLAAFKDVTTAESLGLADGAYTVAVTLAGGSGKVSVQSTAKLTVENGAATAEIVWSSANYDYMIVDGDTVLLPVNTEGNSTFLVPVAAFDRPLAVVADTTAMSQPYEIDYTLTFDSASLAAAS